MGATAGAGLLALGLPGCDPGAGRVSTGGIDDSPTGGVGGGGADPGTDPGNDGADAGTNMSADAATTPPRDLAGGPQPDLAQGPTTTCPSGSVLNAGAASAIAMSTPKHFTDNFNYDLYVVRDANGLYAVTAICTHSGCTNKFSSGKFVCPCHGATFDLNGQHPTSPAPFALEHYALCVDGSGNIIVDYNQTVAASTRA